jgi:hypothetical protein
MARKSVRLPKRFPVGTKYVIEGRTNAEGVFQVSSRYLLMPNGRHIDLPTESRSQPPAHSLAMRAPPTRGRPQRMPPRIGL